MIAALRRRHRAAVIVAALAAPAILVTALAFRVPVVYDSALSAGGNNLPAGTVLMTSNNLRVGAAMLRAQLYATSDTGAASYLTIGRVENRESAGPDVLIYWQPQPAADRLDTDAVLLGPLSPQRASHFVLPQPTQGGHVVFYSLAHQRVVTAYPLAQLLEEN